MDQSTRERKIQDLVAHKAPEELAGMVVDAQAAKDDERNAKDREPSQQQDAQQSQPTPKTFSNRTQADPNQPVTAGDAEKAEPVDEALEKNEQAKRKHR